MRTVARVFVLALVLAVGARGLGYAQEKNQQYFPHGGANSEEHDHSHKVVVGGLLTYWSDLKMKNVHAEIAPELGLFLSSDWVIGLIGKYAYEGHTHETTPGTVHREHVFGLSPFARYYYVHREPFNLYLDATFGWSLAKETQEKGIHGLEIGVRPGACVDLTEGICLCLRMGFIGWRKDFRAVEAEGHEEANYSGFGFMFTPEELQIGLELEF